MQDFDTRNFNDFLDGEFSLRGDMNSRRKSSIHEGASQNLPAREIRTTANRSHQSYHRTYWLSPVFKNGEKRAEQKRSPRSSVVGRHVTLRYSCSCDRS